MKRPVTLRQKKIDRRTKVGKAHKAMMTAVMAVVTQHRRTGETILTRPMSTTMTELLVEQLHKQVAYADAVLEHKAQRKLERRSYRRGGRAVAR